ncbi:MAG TPA: metal-dependent hydrolase [archaeon]|nr:metal-dependent hydrolase [archaeon]
MELQYLGHSGFYIQHEGLNILIDPYLSQDDKREDEPAVDPRTLTPNFILLTHEHFDHCDVAVVNMLSKRHSAKVLGPPQVDRVLGQKVIKVRPGNELKYDKFMLRIIPAFHHQSEFPVGYLMDFNGFRIYHAGDTYYDDKLAHVNTDVALLPIGGTYTMNVEEAAQLANRIAARMTVPMHYNTFGNIKADPQAFCKLVKEGKCAVMQPGEVMKIER